LLLVVCCSVAISDGVVVVCILDARVCRVMLLFELLSGLPVKAARYLFVVVVVIVVMGVLIDVAAENDESDGNGRPLQAAPAGKTNIRRKVNAHDANTGDVGKETTL